MKDQSASFTFTYKILLAIEEQPSSQLFSRVFRELRQNNVQAHELSRVRSAMYNSIEQGRKKQNVGAVQIT